jgi:hypothetical protein
MDALEREGIERRGKADRRLRPGDHYHALLANGKVERSIL